MRRSYLTIIAAVVTAAISFGAIAQTFTPPAGVTFELYLYPITKFRGLPEVVTKSMPKLVRGGNFESLHITRGIWEICSDVDYGGRCYRVAGSQAGLGQPITVRSARLIADTGPTFAPSPTSKPGPDVSPPPRGEVVIDRPAPGPVVAPKADQGGAPGTNPSLKGMTAEFYAAPARNGFRVLACPSGGNAPRCVQATADGFCAERGYRDSAYRGIEVVRDRTYLADVLCKSAPDNDSRGFRLPFTGK